MTKKKNEIAKIQGFTPPVVGADVHVTQDHLVAISVGAAEDALYQRRGELEKEIRALKKEMEALNEKTEKGYATALKKEMGRLKNILSPTFKKLGMEVAVKYSQFTTDFENHKIKFDYFFQEKDRWGGGSIGHTSEIKMPSEVEKAHKKFKEEKERYTTLMQDLYEVQRKLDELPRMERRAKAKLAKAILSQTEDGREILRELEEKTSLD